MKSGGDGTRNTSYLLLTMDGCYLLLSIFSMISEGRQTRPQNMIQPQFGIWLNAMYIPAPNSAIEVTDRKMKNNLVFIAFTL